MSNLVDIQVTSQLYQMFTLTHLCNIHIWRACTEQHALTLCTKVWQVWLLLIKMISDLVLYGVERHPQSKY